MLQPGSGSAYVRAASGGRSARRAPEVILALVAPRAFLDPALDLTRQTTLGWAKRVAVDPHLLEWVAQAWTTGNFHDKNFRNKIAGSRFEKDSCALIPVRYVF